MLTVNIAGVAHAYDITDNRPQKAASSEEISKTLSVEASKAADAPTLVFIHGWLLSRTYWQPLVEALSTDYRCLTYDLRGFGESTNKTTNQGAPSDGQSGNQSKELAKELSREIKIPADRALTETCGNKTEAYKASAYSLAAYAQDLRALLDQLGINKAWVLGHSLGGSVALWAAYLIQEQITGVVCINAGGGIYVPKEFEKFRAAGQQMVKFRPSWLQNMPLLPRLFTRAMVRQPLALAWGKQRLLDFIRADRQAAEGALLETTTEAEVHLLPQVLGQITQPVHFITATEDTIMPPRYVRYLASFHPHFREAEKEAEEKTEEKTKKEPGKEAEKGNASVSEIPNCGHMAMVEQSAAVAKIIRKVIG